jgi:hypothetical protein
MGIYRGYEVATGDSGGPSKGNLALTEWFLDNYESRGGADLGIYVGKRLGSGWSLHAEGRASDLGTKPYEKPSWGWGLANLLKDHSLELGIQCIIFNGKIWSGSYPDAGWRDYDGSDPHNGHLHAETSKHASRTLTRSKIDSILGGGSGGGSSPKPSAPSSGGSAKWQERITGKMELIDLSNVKTGNRGTYVKNGPVEQLQGLLLADGYGPKGLVGGNSLPDGIAGPATRAFLGHFQEKHKTGYSSNPGKADYKAGEKTWAKLLRV